MDIDGKKIAQNIEKEVKEDIKNRKISTKISFILVGKNSASYTYVSMKEKACQRVGINSDVIILDESVSEAEIVNRIEILNEDDSVDAILVQLPLPTHLDSRKILDSVDPDKDVDGLHILNIGRLSIGKSLFVPCTPLAIVTLLKRYNISLSGKHLVIVGRSDIVGRPLAHLLMKDKSLGSPTLTIAHSKTKNLGEITSMGDILVVAIGNPNFIKSDMVKDRAVVVDVGINRLNGRLVGDVDYQKVYPKCSMITPVPGGVGPMTISMLLKNTIYATRRKN